MNLTYDLGRIGSISAPYQLNPLTTRRQIAQILVQTLSYPAEFEHQPPSNSALAHSQAHLSMPLARSGHSSIQPLHRPLAALYMQPGVRAGSCA